MFGKNVIILALEFSCLWLILGVERVVGLPGLFIFGWLILASQLRLRTKLIGSLINGLLLAALYGFGWHWGFMLLWLGTWFAANAKLTPLQRWWRILSWSLISAWIVGGLAQQNSINSFSWLAWSWPAIWLGLIFLLKFRRSL